MVKSKQIDIKLFQNNVLTFQSTTAQTDKLKVFDTYRLKRNL